MQYTFNIKKTIQAASLLLRCEDGTMSYMKLIKLLYIADRESIKETGRPMTGDMHFALPHGPVLSHTLDLIKQKHTCTWEWSTFIETNGMDAVTTDADPGIGDLCRWDLRKLREISEKYKGLDQWDLREITHRFPEYIQNDPANTDSNSNPIGLHDILTALNMEDQEAEILEDLQEMKKHEALFSGG